MLSVENITTFYGASQALFGMTLAAGKGEVVTLMGRNGMGKTTTVRSIIGFTPASSGTITFDGQRTERWPAYRVAQAGVGLVPEGRQIFPNLSVHENLFATSANRRNQPNAWTLDRVYELFPRLAERRKHMGNQISGGEQQMVAIGRAMMSAPSILMLDEPSLGLSPLLCTEFFRALARVRETGVGVLLVEQNARQSLAIADRGYLLDNGRIAGSGSADELASDEAVQKAYLGGG
jgi:branched-chain amino acid transport system ATP-binding protein